MKVTVRLFLSWALTVLIAQVSVELGQGDRLEATSIPPSQAFEVFAGKAYATPAAGETVRSVFMNKVMGW